MKDGKRAVMTVRTDPPEAAPPMATVQLPAELVGRVDAWADAQDIPTRLEAICRLLEVGLSVDGLHSSATALRDRAATLAGSQIDQMGDAKATVGERATRKRRLTDGPSAFRSVRRDRPGED